MNDLPLFPTPQQATSYALSLSSTPRKQPQPQARPPPGPRHGSNQSSQSHQQYQQARPPQAYAQPTPAEYYNSQTAHAGRSPPPHAPYQQPIHHQHSSPKPSYQQPVYQNPPQGYNQPPPPVTPMHTSYQSQVPPPQKQPAYQVAVAPQQIPQQVYQNDGHIPPKARKQSYGSSPPRSVNRSRESLPEKTVSSKQKLEMELRSVFEKVDVDHSGRISAKELSYALLNFDRTRFQDSTVKLMINLFSSESSSKSLNFEQFVSLWKYLSAYKKLFVQADTDKSGDISFGEFQKVLEQIGYKLDTDLVLHLFLKYSERDEGRVGRLKFDSFIELLVYLRKLTDVFKKYDKDLSGTAVISFSNFLFEVSSLT